LLSSYSVAAARARNAEASYFAPCQDVSGLTRYLFHDPSALGDLTLPNLLSIASDCRSDESPNIYIRSIEMNNRNQNQARLPVEPAATPTYLNVFTVEEYEANGKTQKKWTRIGAAFPHKEGLGFSIELKAFPIDGRLVVLPPDTDDGNSRNGK
jgi:hypothetical protein